MSFGTLLKEKRREAGVTQRELAKSIGVDFSYISKLENDRLPPPAAETIVAIAETLKVASEELLAEAGKLPDDIQKSIGESLAAQEFLRDAKDFDLSDEEWSKMRDSLRKLRDD